MQPRRLSVQHPGAKRRALQQAGATERNLISIRSADLISVLILKKGYVAAGYFPSFAAAAFNRSKRQHRPV
jgi:hypothetical protein